MAFSTGSAGPLVRLIYRSRLLTPAIGDDVAQSVATILERSRENNRRTGITGLLLFNGAIFLQIIEGKLQNIEAVYETIACDQRHEDIEVIEFSVVHQREYPEWSMAFIDATVQENEDLRRFLARPTATQTSRLANEFFEASRRCGRPNDVPRRNPMEHAAKSASAARNTAQPAAA